MAAIPDAAVSFLLENLQDFVVSNAELIGGAKDNADKLCSDLEVLKGFLKKCTEERYRDDDFLAGLAKKVRKLVYRAEDAIETYIATVSKQKSRGAWGGVVHKIDHTLELRKIGKELDDLNREVQGTYEQEIAKGLLVIHGADKVPGKDDEGIVKKHPVDDDMVGFKDVMEEVMGLLNDGPDDLQTISIVGMLGLGKTTLAKQVFKHPTVEYQFFIRAFVEVSQEFKRAELLIKLLRAFGNIRAKDMNEMDEEELEKSIKEYLDKRNYLIILDDVWTKDAWNQLKTCFPNNQKKSRVLITTRNKDVAEHARQGLGIEPYHLRFLKDKESMELLRKRVFGKTDPIRPDLEEHETEIVRGCNGLPLAIVVVAGILTNHREESYWWEDVSKKVKIYNVADEAGVDHTIKLSFNHLPYRLKPCFLYLGVFREDFEIPSRTLYRLWVSEGFVPLGDANETSEDKAESYLEQLVDRSLVMVAKRRLNGRIKTIRIHDTLREFCKNQAVVEELFREIKSVEEVGKMSPDDRRLCINSKVGEYITSTNKRTGKFVRSFLSFAKEDYILPLEYISEIPKSFKLLRVLDVRSIRFTRFPSELFYTFLLKYIAMCSELETIPEKVSNLRYLQTLIFNTTKRNIEIKADIWKMKQLRHLETNTPTSLQKTKEAPSINANLQTLSSISPESCTPELFKRAQLLKKLGICGELASSMETLFPSLIELECLENLKLLNVNTTVPLKSLPNENSFPRKLTRLTLQNTMLSWECMSTLAKLKKLEVLKLKENAFEGAFWNTENTGGFSALKVFHIENAHLMTWKASKGHFPQLTHLYLRHCTRLGDIPSDLVNISMLKLIDIYCCKPEVATSARKLVLAKLQVQAQENNARSTQLKLFIYPPEQ